MTLARVGVTLTAAPKKGTVAITDGFRKTTGSRADLLGDSRRCACGHRYWPIGDGALGFWTAMREVFPATREQR